MVEPISARPENEYVRGYHTCDRLVDIVTGRQQPPVGGGSNMTHSFLIMPIITCVGALLYGDNQQPNANTQDDDKFASEKRLLAVLPQAVKDYLREIAIAIAAGAVPLPNALLTYLKKENWPEGEADHLTYLSAETQGAVMWMFVAARTVHYHQGQGVFVAATNAGLQPRQQSHSLGDNVINLGFTQVEVLMATLNPEHCQLDPNFVFAPVRPPSARMRNSGLRGIRVADMSNQLWAYLSGQQRSFNLVNPWSVPGLRDDQPPDGGRGRGSGRGRAPAGAGPGQGPAPASVPRSRSRGRAGSNAATAGEGTNRGTFFFRFLSVTDFLLLGDSTKNISSVKKKSLFAG